MDIKQSGTDNIKPKQHDISRLSGNETEDNKKASKDILFEKNNSSDEDTISYNSYKENNDDKDSGSTNTHKYEALRATSSQKDDETLATSQNKSHERDNSHTTGPNRSDQDDVLRTSSTTRLYQFEECSDTSLNQLDQDFGATNPNRLDQDEESSPTSPNRLKQDEDFGVTRPHMLDHDEDAIDTRKNRLAPESNFRATSPNRFAQDVECNATSISRLDQNCRATSSNRSNQDEDSSSTSPNRLNQFEDFYATRPNILDQYKDIRATRTNRLYQDEDFRATSPNKLGHHEEYSATSPYKLDQDATSPNISNQDDETFLATSQNVSDQDGDFSATSPNRLDQDDTSPNRSNQDDETFPTTSQNRSDQDGDSHSRNSEINFEQKIPRDIIGTVLNVQLEGEFFTKTISPRGSFPIDKSDWDSLEDFFMKRRLKRGSWHKIMIKGITTLNPYCTFMIKRHHVNISKFKTRRKGSRLFQADLYCCFKDCNMTCRLEMFTNKEVHCIFNGKIKHNFKEQRSRPISGRERKEMKDELRFGQKPYKYYLKRFSEIPDTVKVAGNLSNVGSSPNVIRKIASEAKKEGALDPDEWTSLLKMSDAMINKSTEKSVKGFIQHISIKPCFILYWNDAGVRLWHCLAKDGVAFWDATGSVISELNGKRHLYYELAIANPIPGEPSIPITAMLTTSHDTPQIKYWISKFRHQEKKIFGHNNAVVPRQINSDRSLVFIQAALNEFNSESLDKFRSRAWRIITGAHNSEDITKMIPHVCLSHTMKNFRDACRQYYKANFEYGMYILSLLVNVETLRTATLCLKSLLTVLLSRKRTKKVEEAAAFLDKQIQLLPELSTDNAENSITEIDEWLKSVDINPNLYTEEDYTMRKKTNEFYIWADGIKNEVKMEIQTEDESTTALNKRHSTELAEHLLKNYISFFPIWSNILLGDLTRHIKANNQTLEQTPVTRKIERKTNAIVEQRFRVLKDIAFGGEKKTRIDIFSLDLERHFDTILKLAVLKNLKTSKKTMKKASKTIEEGWNKKGPKVHVDVGKYQTPPKREIKAFPTRKGSKCKTDIDKQPQVSSIHPSHLERDHGTQGSSTVHFPEDNTPTKQRKDMIEDLASKQFQTATMCTNIDSSLDTSKYLRELFCIQARDSMSLNYLDNFKEKRTGIPNYLSVTCWFSAMVQLFCNSVFMMNINEEYLQNLSFEPELRSVLAIFHRTAVGNEVQRGDIQKAMAELNTRYGINTTRQNDAHEFMSTAISDLMLINGPTSTIEMEEAIGCSECGYRSLKKYSHNDIQLRVPSTEIKDCANISRGFMESNDIWEGPGKKFWSAIKKTMELIKNKPNQEESWKRLVEKQNKKIEEYNKK